MFVFQGSIYTLRHLFDYRLLQKFIFVLGEGKAVTEDMTACWFETRLPTILSNYELPDIYNADEFGLFFQVLPSKFIHLKDEKCIGGKFSKVRLTVLAAANGNGEKLPMFIIGKSKSPRCFKNLNQLPCRYIGQKKSWMDSDLFESLSSRIGRLC